jgi:hypothetical protein
MIPSRFSFRLLLPLLGIAMIAGAVLTVLRSTASGAEAANGDYVIDILSNSFNPPLCVVNRSNNGGVTTVRFRNKDSKPRRMIVPDVSTEPTAPPLEDTGYIPAGETSTWNLGITANYDRTFKDADNPSLTIRIVAPQDPNAASSCDQLPPTPTPTPTPSPTPIPTPTQRPPACTGLAPVSRQPVIGCGVAGNLAKDNEDEQP